MNEMLAGPLNWRKRLKLESFEEQTVTFGTLGLRLKVEEQDLWISAHRLENGTSGGEPKWSRWPVGSFSRVGFEPIFPDLPVVVKPQVEVLLYPKSEMVVYVACPLWIRILLKGKEKVILVEHPSQVLSQTWFGPSPVEGNLCYWVPSDVSRSIPGSLESSAVLPVNIRNTSSEELSIQRICLRTAHLTLYWHKETDRFWSDHIRIDFRGKHGRSEFTVAGHPPDEAPEARKLVSPRERTLSRLVAMTFATVRDLPSFFGG